MKRILLALLCPILFVIPYAPAWAEPDPSGITWDQLTPKEQRILQPLKETWDQLPPARPNNGNRPANDSKGGSKYLRNKRNGFDNDFKDFANSPRKNAGCFAKGGNGSKASRPNAAKNSGNSGER